MSDHHNDAAALAAFTAAERSLRAVGVRPEVRLDEVAPPTSLAPFALGLVASIPADAAGSTEDDAAWPGAPEESAGGRFVLLHDPEGPQGWDGVWRVVTYTRGAVRPDRAEEPDVAGGVWSCLTAALAARGAHHVALAGAVTRVVDQRFGGLAERPEGEVATVDLEIRASWTPLSAPGSVGAHLLAFTDVLAGLAGLAPTPEGVAILPRGWR